MSNTKNFLILFIYTLAYAAALLTLAHLAAADDQAFFKEGQWLEGTHQALLAITIGVAIAGAMLRPAWRRVFVVLALLGLLGSVRELNDFFRTALPGLGWKVPGIAVLVVLTAYVARTRRQLGRELFRFIRTDAFGMLWAGLVITALMAQQIGHGEFLEPLLADDYQPVYKRVIEEVIEVFGYLMIALGTLQTVLRAPRGETDASPA